MAPPLIALEDVLARRGPTFRMALRHFTVAPGEAVAIVGRSGSGKSTCLDVMAGILRPDAGGRFEMRVGPGPVPVSVPELWATPRQDGLRELRGRHLGYVLQTGGLVPFLSIGENIELPIRRSGRRDPGRVAVLLERLGLAGLGNRKPRAVSIGERQRAAVARALAHRPALVLADEPTASVDPETAETVMTLLTTAARQEGAALVLVTHDLELARMHGLRITICASGDAPGLSVLDDRSPA
jgi:putative ABC transport system ATP-binding protein